MAVVFQHIVHGRIYDFAQIYNKQEMKYSVSVHVEKIKYTFHMIQDEQHMWSIDQKEVRVLPDVIKQDQPSLNIAITIKLQGN